MILNKKFKASTELKSLLNVSHIKGHRALLFLTTGNNDEADLPRDQVMIIHHLLSKTFSERPNVLWCHKQDTKYPRVSKSVLKKLEKKIRSGQCDISTENAFHVFLLSTQVTYCAWNNAQGILGKTFDMCVIQDFEALTPNVLCQLVETVRGGGVIIFLLPPELDSVRDLYSTHMDSHNKFRTHSTPQPHHRFNERFILSLRWCKSCLVLGEDLNVLPEALALSKHALTDSSDKTLKSTEPPSQSGLTELLESLTDAEKPLPQLVKLCRTLDQAKSVLKMIDVVTDKDSRTTVSVTAGRGRGKSAALGLATAAAVFFGVNNIFVTSPSPENLSTFFEFVFKGFDSLDYKEGEHYDVIQSTNLEFKGAIVRVNVFARHRQVIQYVRPVDSCKVTQGELLIIDEAASIPLTQVRALMGPMNVFMASTINGYEGTGRSLSLKLLKELRKQSVPVGATAVVGVSDAEKAVFTNCRPLFELTLEESIRYNPGDPVESWLYRCLCLDAPSVVPPVGHCPPPDSCQLFYVNRDVLFSGHPDSEVFLNQLMSLLVSSHYKNCPDDLHALADSPSHHLFVLAPVLNPKKGSVSSLPTPFTVVQVCIEGSIPSSVSSAILQRGENPSGDLIPWVLAKQFLDPGLTQLKGARIIRIATHPDYQSMGYGYRSIKLLKEYYEGRFVSLDEEDRDRPIAKEGNEMEEFKPRTFGSPLLLKLNERNPESLDFLGVSFGLTEQLFKFWKKSAFLPLNISLSTNKTTGEHNCIMVHPLVEDGFNLNSTDLPEWLRDLTSQFLSRFLTLLAGPFRKFHPRLSRAVVWCFQEANASLEEISWAELEPLVGGPDLKRLDSYCRNLSERHLVSDLLHSVAKLYFEGKLPSIRLSPAQTDLLIGCGLQYLNVDEVSKHIDLPLESALGQFNRALKRLFKVLSEVQEKSVAELIPKTQFQDFTPVTISLDRELDEAAQDYEDKHPSLPYHQQFGDLAEFAVKGTEQDWNTTEGGVVKIKRAKKLPRMTDAEYEKEVAFPQTKKSNNKSSKPKKRRKT